MGLLEFISPVAYQLLHLGYVSVLHFLFYMNYIFFFWFEWMINFKRK